MSSSLSYAPIIKVAGKQARSLASRCKVRSQRLSLSLVTLPHVYRRRFPKVSDGAALEPLLAQISGPARGLHNTSLASLSFSMDPPKRSITSSRLSLTHLSPFPDTLMG